jgi:hypothetical protein
MTTRIDITKLPGPMPVTTIAHHAARTADVDATLVRKSVETLLPFIPRHQLEVVADACRRDDREFFFAKMIELGTLVEKMPVQYQTKDQGDDAVVWLHYFSAATDYYIIEKDSNYDGEGQCQAFGMTRDQNGERMGYIAISEIIKTKAFELDFHFKPTALGKIAAPIHDPAPNRGLTLADFA